MEKEHTKSKDSHNVKSWHQQSQKTSSCSHIDCISTINVMLFWKEQPRQSLKTFTYLKPHLIAMVLVLEALFVSFLNVNWLPFPPLTKIPSLGAIDVNFQALMQLWWLLYCYFLSKCKMGVLFISSIDTKMWSLRFHLLSKLKTSKFEMRFVFIQSFSYCYLLFKFRACIVFVSSLNAHLGCCLYFCFVSKHKSQKYLRYSSTHYFGSWAKPLHLKSL